ncbi:MAG: peroxiredoxin [Firmicutes bacterium]|nr:peroxiredoxin [Alicyclobacillaceae bacterium]MCL6498161.1 peroxiredoxin [Bacillota bacterium]
MALVGQKAPEFEMPAILPSGEMGTVRCRDYRGRWLVFFFYPHDFTFVCPTEITAFSDAWRDFQAEGADIVGVSTDSPHVHRAWIKTDRAHGGLGPLRYPLASDWTHRVSRDYQVYYPDEGAAYRGLFLINPDGVVEYEVVHNLNVGRSVDEVLRVLKALKAGGLCPVNWHPGQALLEPV